MRIFLPTRRSGELALADIGAGQGASASLPLSPLSFLDRAVAAFGDRPAVITRSGRRLDYRELHAEAVAVAGALRRSGWSGTDVQVAVLSRNGPELLASHYAVPGAGATLVALNTRLAPAEYRHILDHSEAKVLLVDPGLAERIAPVRGSLRCEVVVLPDPDTGARADLDGTPYDQWRDPRSSPGTLDRPASEHERIAINYTSGTTGSPKGAIYTHRGAYLNSLSVALTLGLRSTSRFLWTLPMFHCNGWCCTWAVTAVGATHVTIADFDPNAVLELIGRHRVSHLCGAPVVLQMLSDAGRAGGVPFEHDVSVATGGAPPSADTLAAMRELGIDVVHLYGLTECYGPSLVADPDPRWDALPLDERDGRLSRQGLPMVGVDAARVVDDAGRAVPADGATIGELTVRSNTVAAGYFKDDGGSATFVDGWLRTGDLAVVDPDGYVSIRDRKKDVIISGGENVSSIEVENCLMSHPAVSEAAVVAMPSSRWGEVPAAFVALRPGASVTADELIDHVRGRLAGFKAPKKVVFADLPRTSTGKVMKHRLREMATDVSTHA